MNKNMDDRRGGDVELGNRSSKVQLVNDERANKYKSNDPTSNNNTNNNYNRSIEQSVEKPLYLEEDSPH